MPQSCDFALHPNSGLIFLTPRIVNGNSRTGLSRRFLPIAKQESCCLPAIQFALPRPHFLGCQAVLVGRDILMAISDDTGFLSFHGLPMMERGKGECRLSGHATKPATIKKNFKNTS